MSLSNTIELTYQRGNALRMSGSLAQAEAALREVLRSAPAHRDAAFSLAYMLREEGRLNAAADVVLALWQSSPDGVDTALSALGFLNECSAYAQAQVLAGDARRRWPNDARIAAKAGEIALALGAFDDATAALREALDRNPQQSAAWLRLAHCRRCTDHEDPDLARFRRAWADTGLNSSAHICTGFALAKALDDLGDYAQAADVVRQANGLALSVSNWSNAGWRQFVQLRLSASPLPMLAADPDFVPVFVIGLPRTGTTLTASTLARHASVRDRGELNWIPALYEHLRAQEQLHNSAALVSIARLIKLQMRRDDAPVRFYVDKNPLNFRYLDFIVACFPNAKIIHCRRNSRDTALSLWMQHFAHEDLGFSYDFRAIAEVEKGYRSLMAHWRSNLPIDIFDLDYETFVAQSQAQLPRLAQFLGIADEASMPHTNSNQDAITTASVWQARQPVYAHAVERWRRYAPLIPELIEHFPD